MSDLPTPLGNHVLAMLSTMLKLRLAAKRTSALFLEPARPSGANMVWRSRPDALRKFARSMNTTASPDGTKECADLDPPTLVLPMWPKPVRLGSFPGQLIQLFG